MNPYQIQLLKLNLLALAVYESTCPIEELLITKWEDIHLDDESISLWINGNKLVIKNVHFCIFLKELYRTSSPKKSEYIFLD
ncbi:hypothetical protein ABE26_15065 [Cytobacillus firmus]|nr:hypothetical protein [Cytobacillus firmus]